MRFPLSGKSGDARRGGKGEEGSHYRVGGAGRKGREISGERVCVSGEGVRSFRVVCVFVSCHSARLVRLWLSVPLRGK